MSRREKVMVGLITQKWPQIAPEDILRWIHRRNDFFDDISPASFEDKFGAKRFKKKVAAMKEFI